MRLVTKLAYRRVDVAGGGLGVVPPLIAAADRSEVPLALQRLLIFES